MRKVNCCCYTVQTATLTKKLEPNNPIKRLTLCEDLLVMFEKHECLLERIIFSDATIHLSGKVNSTTSKHRVPKSSVLIQMERSPKVNLFCEVSRKRVLAKKNARGSPPLDMLSLSYFSITDEVSFIETEGSGSFFFSCTL